MQNKLKNILLILALIPVFTKCTEHRSEGFIMSVQGPVPMSKLGTTLIHEHILVDFVGADSISYDRWDRTEVIKKVLPYLQEIRDSGCSTLIDCTPAWLGRDPLLLKILADSSGLNILTNTGYYGALNNKYLPSHTFRETAEQIAARWIREWQDGIDGTGIKPGFIKTGVNPGMLSDLHKKLIKAAAITHLKTGLTIASHTGPALPAFEELAILESEGVAASAFIWVHAQSESDHSTHVRAAKKGAWISLDGVSEENTKDYVAMISNLKANGLLDRVLVSHDAGWYTPGEPDGGSFRGYTALFTSLLPALKEAGYSEEELTQLLVHNPARAFEVRIRKADK
ncbi:MAG: phosphotriesterase [Bacteroidetes bacterium]|nr:phosphotriesterase [Bacteroidota bacterium]